MTWRLDFSAWLYERQLQVYPLAFRKRFANYPRKPSTSVGPAGWCACGWQRFGMGSGLPRSSGASAFSKEGA